MKNKLLGVLMLAFIPTSLICSVAIKSVNAQTSVVQTLETQESSVEVDNEAPELNKAPAPATNTSEIPTTKPLLKTQIETEGFTTQTTHSYSSPPASTTGAQATCSLISWKILNLSKDDAAQITCDITDTSNDGDSVYVKWWLDGYGDVHLTNSKGSGAPPTHETDARRNLDGSIGHVYWQVCRDVPFWEDNCSKVQSWAIK